MTTKAANKGNIRLKRVFELTNSTSLAITLPRAFIRKLGLRAGALVKCELHNNDKSIVVQGLNLV